MISNERLEQLADEQRICKVSWDERIELAREILALRKAISERAGTLEVTEHHVTDIAWDGDWIDGCPVGEYIVIRKPDMAGGDGC